MKKILIPLVLGVSLFFVFASADAALESRLGGQAVYDTDLDITWLADSNLAMTSGFEPNGGFMSWDDANAWAAGLTVGGFTDWRLPITLVPDASCTDDKTGTRPAADPRGWNCTGSEMGHLFYIELGHLAGDFIRDSDDPDLALFTNIEDGFYWSGTEAASSPNFAWMFWSIQVRDFKGVTHFAWAVRSGDVSNMPPGIRFADVPADFWAVSFIETLADSGITTGCGNGNYCPDGPVTRAQMAVFLERGINGSSFSPSAASGNAFLDVPAGSFAASFIEQFSLDGITSGCGGNNYCPNDNVTRAQMAVFLMRAKFGSSFSPPAATGVFGDVSPGAFAANFIERLAAEGITSGCGNGNYCPDAVVTRDQMAVFLVRTFGL